MGDQRPVPAVLPRKSPGTHCMGGWVVLRAGLARCGKSPPTEMRSEERPTRSESLYRRHPGSHDMIYCNLMEEVFNFPAHCIL